MSIFKNNFVMALTAGLAATVIAPVLIFAIKRTGRPLAKSVLKGGIVLYEKGREAVAGTGELMEDVIAEVQAEMIEKKVFKMEAEGPEPAVTAPPQQSATHHGNNSSAQRRTVKKESPPAQEASTAE